jgi:hypothetical protein
MRHSKQHMACMPCSKPLHVQGCAEHDRLTEASTTIMQPGYSFTLLLSIDGLLDASLLAASMHATYCV